MVSPSVLVVVAAVQVSPPSVVNTISVSWDEDCPTATPLFASLIETPYMALEEGTFVVVASVQFLPPSVVYTICPEAPTATPLFASLIDTPFIIVLPTAVVVASVQVSTAAYASKSDGE